MRRRRTNSFTNLARDSSALRARRGTHIGFLTRRGDKRLAFTLAEVAVSIFVLTIALQGVAGAISFGGNADEHGRSVTEAQTYAREIMEFITSNNLAWSSTVTMPAASTGLNDSAGTYQALSATPLTTSGINFPSDSPYRRHIEVTSSNCTTDTTNSAQWKLDVRQINVTIQWFEGGASRAIVLKTFQRRPL